MIYTNRAVIVYFPTHSNQYQTSVSSSAPIYVPFLVSEVHVRGIHPNFDADFREMYFTSPLVDGYPHGCAFAGILRDMTAPYQSIKYLFPTPRDINGEYSFTYNTIDPNAFYFPFGYQTNIGESTQIPTMGSFAGLLANDGSNLYPAIGANAIVGAPPGRVLFILEFIGYK